MTPQEIITEIKSRKGYDIQFYDYTAQKYIIQIEYVVAAFELQKRIS